MKANLKIFLVGGGVGCIAECLCFFLLKVLEIVCFCDFYQNILFLKSANFNNFRPFQNLFCKKNNN